MIEEWFVNVLAIDILMPDEQVDRMWVDPHLTIPDMAKYFNVLRCWKRLPLLRVPNVSYIASWENAC